MDVIDKPEQGGVRLRGLFLRHKGYYCTQHITCRSTLSLTRDQMQILTVTTLFVHIEARAAAMGSTL